MKRNLYITMAIVLFLLILALRIGNTSAYEVITAQEAYDMISTGQAIIIDVRTLEEYVFVGSPALESEGDPIAYLISWKIFNGIDENGAVKLIDNPEFDKLVSQTFGDDKTRPLITMCACGIRSSFAAQRLETLGFTNVYEIDNKLKEASHFPGGIGGGFQGTSYNGLYDGYKGYPYRTDNGPADISLETISDNIVNENDPVSWMDTGLPITHKNDPNKIPKIAKDESPKKSNNTNVTLQTQKIMPFMNYQWPAGLILQTTFPSSFYQSSPIGSMVHYGQQFLSSATYNFYQANQFINPYSNAFSIQKLISVQPSGPTYEDLTQISSP
ncbi:MAG: rhodanese-like domain-containing protein [bacterium]